ncbi:PAS domain-containing protein, partial [Paraburkholderia sp. SIMBA_009]
DLLARLADLNSYDVTDEERHEPGSFSRDLLAALHNLTGQISSTGLSQTVRSRLSDDDARRLRGTLHGLPCGVIVLDRAGAVVHANARALEMLAMT